MIRPGLQKIIDAYTVWAAKKRALHAYPMGVFPIKNDRLKGSYAAEMMAEVESAWRKLQARRRGGRLRMEAIEIRAAILALRIEQDHRRVGAHQTRKSTQRVRQLMGVDLQSRAALKNDSTRVIRALERFMKRANRRLAAKLTEDDYRFVVDRWQAHLRWIRFHLCYFRPLPPIGHRKRAQQALIDIFVDMAKRGLIEYGYVPPDAATIRKLVRLFVRYMRRGREPYPLRYMLNPKNSVGCRRVLAIFVTRRVELKQRSTR